MLDRDESRIPRLAPILAVCRLIGLKPVWIRHERSAGGKGWHVVIRLTRPLQPAETVAVQACMGSDPRREALNCMRVIAIRQNRITNRFWLKRWNLLYAAKL